MTRPLDIFLPALVLALALGGGGVWTGIGAESVPNVRPACHPGNPE